MMLTKCNKETSGETDHFLFHAIVASKKCFNYANINLSYIPILSLITQTITVFFQSVKKKLFL